jgi:carbamoyl-phosphate synthase large subunit
LADLKLWAFPLVVKPAGGSASQGVLKVHDVEGLRAASRHGDFIVQTLASGREYTIDVLVNRDGKCVCAVPRKRIEVRGGEVTKGVTVRHAAMQTLATRIAEALPGAFGPMNVQVFLDSNNDELAVIEINTRFGGGYPLAWQAGANFPRWIIEEILGRPSTAMPDEWRDGLMMLRYFEAVYIDP